MVVIHFGHQSANNISHNNNEPAKLDIAKQVVGW